MNLTGRNGVKINVDRKKVLEMGPHIDGGSFIKVGSQRILVQEPVEEILKQSPIAGVPEVLKLP